MKLVELLARELKEWPSNAYVAVQDDDSDHTIWFLESDHHGLSFISGEWKCSYPFDILISRPSILASDHATAIVTRSDWSAERARIAKPAKKADKDGWIRHRGGKCPVDGEIKVEARQRGGQIVIENAQDFWWEHRSNGGDIMAYRPHKPAEQVEACSKPDPRDSAKRDSDYVCWMRDRITEIDATTKALTTERANLVQKLASEGFALIGRAQDAPISLPRDEWKIGDLVMLKCKSPKTDMPAGKPLPITEFDGSSFGQDVKVDGFYFPPVSGLIWHSRPSA